MDWFGWKKQVFTMHILVVLPQMKKVMKLGLVLSPSEVSMFFCIYELKRKEVFDEFGSNFFLWFCLG